tara:strand:- start:528 stop:1094 length:567 start_codon:yes stop_codon:yes gene_type:complete
MSEETTTSQEQDRLPQVDFSFQFNTAKEHEKVESIIFELLCDQAKKSLSSRKRAGVLVVLGNFDSSKNHIVFGMRQIEKNPVQKYVNLLTKQSAKEVASLMEANYDGAFVVNRNGQVLGLGIYLTVDQPMLDIPDGSGTRHITAASFSTREDVQAVFTLSEETNIVRIWKGGVFTKQYHPEEELVDQD